MTPVTLTRNLIDDFNAQLQRVGAPLADSWTGGLTDEEIDAILLPLGIDLPEEARVWWRWQNGAERSFAHRGVLPLEYGIEPFASERETMKELWDVDFLLSPVDERPWIYFYCGGARGAPVPVYGQDDDTEAPVEMLPSIGELVGAWTKVLAAGVVTIADDGKWKFHEHNWPIDVPHGVI